MKTKWYLSPAFWVVTITLIAGAATLLSKSLTDAHVGVWLATGAGVGYAVLKLVESDGSEISGGPKTPLFWVFIGSSVVVVLQALPANWSHQAGSVAAGILALVVSYLTSLGVIRNKVAVRAQAPIRKAK